MSPVKSNFRAELALVPGVARFLAALCAYGALVAVMAIALMPHRNEPPPFVLILAVFGGIVIACWILLIGYVNRDAARRGMSPLLWTLICIFVPNLLGFIIYFLLRKPISKQCPGCGFTVDESFRFCPRCRCSLAPVCSSCGQPIKEEYICCPYCGQARSEPGAPPAVSPA